MKKIELVFQIIFLFNFETKAIENVIITMETIQKGTYLQ